MSTITKAIAAVEFQANAKQANAALESIQASARETREEADRLQEALNKGITTMKNAKGIDFDVAKRLREARQEAKAFETASQSLIRGVKAFDELWKNAKLGTIETMTGAQIKAGMNAAKPQMDRLKYGNEEDRQKYRAIVSMTEEAQKVLNKMRLDTDQLIQTIESGGTIAQGVLDREKRGLQDMLSLLATGSEEWQAYNNQLTRINEGIEKQTTLERQLRGEIVSREDAMRVVGRLDDKANQEAITKTNEAIAKTHESIKAKREEIATHQETIAKKNEELATTETAIVKKREEIATVNAAVTAKRDANKAQKEADEGVRLANEELTKQQGILDGLKTKTQDEANTVERLRKELEGLNGTTAKPKVDTTDIDALKAKLEEVKAQRATTNQRIERRSGEIRHGGDAETWQAILTDVQGGKDGRLRSMFIGETKKQFDDVLDVANRFYNIMKKIGTDLGGKQYGSEATEPIKKLAEAYKITEEEARKLLRTLAESTEVQKKYSFSFDERFGLNHVHIQQRKDKDKDLESYNNKTDQQIRIETAEAQLKRAQEWESQQAEAIDKLKKEEQELARQEAELTEQIKRGGEATESSTTADEKKAEAQKQLTAAEGRHAEALKNEQAQETAVATAKGKVTEAEEKQKLATEQSTKANEANTSGLKKLKAEEEGLQNTKKGIITELGQEHDAVATLTGDVNNLTAAEMKQKQELAQMETGSREKIREAISVLERLQEKETNPKLYKENEVALDRLRTKLKEMTGEWMSLSEAQKLAGQVGTNDFITTQQKLQMAMAAVQREIDKTKLSLHDLNSEENRNQKAIDEEKAKLKTLEQQFKDLKFEQDNFNMSHEKMEQLLKQPTSTRDLDELKAAIKRAEDELHRMQDSLGTNKEAAEAFAKQIKEAKIALGQLESQSKASASAFEKAWSRLKTYVGLYVGAAVAMQKIVATMGDLMELSDKMGEVRKTTGFTADEVGRLSDNLKKLDVRTSLTSLMELSSLAGSVGLKTQQDVQGFTEAANQLLIALPEMGNESARTLIKIAQATGDLQKNNNDVRETLEKVGSTIIALRANSASAAGPITDFVSRVGAVGAQAGISIDQIAALGSTIDALGGRVEMSATALSRMIPAIRNNSYAIANSIGVTDSYLKSLSAMDQMVLIFQKLRDSIKGINTETEEGQQQMADNIEAVLGKNAVMAEVMKDLNQQGARAGIVFGLLSQNVDELQKQLGIAGEAYKDNIALQEEFNKMNDTTAAKWARLKNQLEEMFVSDSAQRWLGGLIDNLRKLVDIISGDVTGALKALNVAVWTAAAAFTAFRLGTGEMFIKTLGLLKTGILGVAKAIVTLTTVQGWKNMISGVKTAIGVTKMYISLQWKLVLARDAETKATIKAQLANNALAKSMNANIWMAIIAAIGMLVYKLYDWVQASKEAGREAAKFQAELDKETAKVDKLFESVGKASVRTEEAAKKVDEARKALKAAQEQLDGSKESTDRLTEAEGNLAKAEMELQKEQDNHAGGIKEINSQYGKYLGFMLSEVSSAQELIEVRELLNDKLRETITLKNKEAALGRVEEGMGKDRDESYSYLWDKVQDIATSKDANGKDVKDATKATRTINAITKAAQKSYESLNDFSQEVLKIARENEIGGNLQPLLNYAQKYYLQLEKIRNKTAEIEQQFSAQESVNREQSQKDFERQYQTAVANYNKLEEIYTKASGDAKKKAAADLLKQMDTINGMVDSAERHYELDEKKAYEGEIDNYNNFIKQSNDRIRAMGDQREKLLKEAGDAYRPGDTGGGGGGNNPYGNFNRVTSPYGDWDADSLVNRRKEMLERVRSLANGADVQKVLSEDAKFISEAVRNNIKTTEQAIEWYNAERLKIQEALHEKHLTNTGDWMDPKKGSKKASRMVQDEMKYYLDELDAYYTERKAMIQQQRNDELITEGEAWRQTLQIESEWQQRRGELQQLYGTRREKVAKEETAAILDILSERTEETTDYIKKDIENTVKFIEKVGSEKGKAAMDEIYGDIDLGSEKAYLRQRNAIGKSVQFMADTLAKERPFNGITENLQENLTKMGILEGQVPEKMHFLLGQIESAYTLDVKEMVKRISEAGFKEWAEQISGDTQMQQALLAQLRQAYEAVQEGIRKEASRIKKDADMMWKLMLLPDGTNLKQAADDALAQMTQQQESVGRANSLIGAGTASENVVTRLAIKQLQLQLSVQQAQYALMRKMGEEKAQYLDQLAEEYKLAGDLKKAERARIDAANVRKSINLAITEETKKQAELNRQIAKEQEEAQNRLYKELKGWVDTIASGLQSVFEASNAGAEEFYNERAKLRLTGGTGETQQYIIIDNAGTSDATAHYETLNEMQAAERKFEIERQNAQAEAWKKVMDDINAKMNETITDQLNAMLQNASIDANTDALSTNTAAEKANTDALNALTQMIGNIGSSGSGVNIDGSGMAGVGEALAERMQSQGKESKTPSVEAEGLYPEGSPGYMPEAWQPQTYDWNTAPAPAQAQDWGNRFAEEQKAREELAQQQLALQKQVADGQTQSDQKMAKSSQGMYAKMTQAANLYGVAYQAMSNDNMTTAQKFEMIALQAVGNAAIAGLQVALSQSTAETAANMPAAASRASAEEGPIAGPILFAVLSALVGGLMGLAASKIAKSKSQIAAATGASNATAGRLTTGMLTYAEGNVNEFTDPDSLTPGRQYNVDAADGRTYRARYMGRNPRTHITNGPEFHLAGERGREAIIDAHTTRQIQMDESGIWQAIKTLSSGGSLHGFRLRRNGMRAFAEGNISEYSDYSEYSEVSGGGGGMSAEQMLALQSSLDRNSEVLERALSEGIKGVFNVYGPKGLIDSYDSGKKEAQRHGQRY